MAMWNGVDKLPDRGSTIILYRESAKTGRCFTSMQRSDGHLSDDVICWAYAEPSAKTQKAGRRQVVARRRRREEERAEAYLTFPHMYRLKPLDGEVALH